MMDLVWIGNTLYPRWMVIAAVVTVLLLVTVVLSWLSEKANES